LWQSQAAPPEVVRSGSVRDARDQADDARFDAVVIARRLAAQVWMHPWLAARSAFANSALPDVSWRQTLKRVERVAACWISHG